MRAEYDFTNAVKNDLGIIVFSFAFVKREKVDFYEFTFSFYIAIISKIWYNGIMVKPDEVV